MSFHDILEIEINHKNKLNNPAHTYGLKRTYNEYPYYSGLYPEFWKRMCNFGDYIILEDSRKHPSGKPWVFDLLKYFYSVLKDHSSFFKHCFAAIFFALIFIHPGIRTNWLKRQAYNDGENQSFLGLYRNLFKEIIENILLFENSPSHFSLQMPEPPSG
jgi:hypothetical protein